MQLSRQFFEIIHRKNIYEYSNILFVLCVVLTGYYHIILNGYFNVAGLLTNTGLVTLGGTPIGHDFIAFYSAGKLARSGDPSMVYSVPALHEVQVAVIGADILSWSWIYPPNFLLIIVPLSFLPYLLSFSIWIIGTFVGYLIVIRYIAPHPATPWLFLGFPGAVYNLIAGHNGCFSAMLLGGGLLILDRNPFVAGLLLGILSFKPHLAGLLPIALIAGRCWRALGGFAAAASGLALISLIVFGPTIWISFWKNIPYAATHWQTTFIWAQMPTIYGLARLLNAKLFVSIFLQGITTSLAVIILVWVWSRRASLPLRGSMLVLCILLSSPYLFIYDLALLGLPFAWLGWELYVRSERKGQILLMALWLSLYWSIFSLGGKILPVILTILGVMFSYTIYRSIYSHKHII
jgi:hypothetical protein